jgi:transcriptional regulator with XRE-family HTH domain
MDNTISIISTNIIELRDAVGLSQKDFALLANISPPTLVNIESGKKTFKMSSLDGILSFTNIRLEDLTKVNFVPPKNLREKLAQKYKDDVSMFVLLSKQPSITYCIKYKLLQTDFLNIPKETNQIKQFFEKIGWVFKGNSIHTALKRMPDLIKIEPHPSKKGTSVYLKK